LSEIDLDTILLLPGDLPPACVGGQIRSAVPRQFGDLPAADSVVTQDLYDGDYKAEPGVMILLYESSSDLDEAYEGVCTSEELSQQVADVGERAMASESYNTLFNVGSATLVFVRCHALVYLDLFSPTADTEVVVAYAQRLDERLSPLVCR
jgi:hypothetical protein